MGEWWETNLQQPRRERCLLECDLRARLVGKGLSLCMEIMKDQSSMNLPHSHLCPWASYFLLQSPQQRDSKDNNLCTKRHPPSSHSGLSLSPAQVALAGPWHHHSCWHGCPLQPWLIPQTGISHVPVTLLGSLFSLTPCLGCSPPAPHHWAAGHGGEQCLLHSHLLLYQCPCTFLLTQLFLLLITSSPNSPPSRPSRQ